MNQIFSAAAFSSAAVIPAAAVESLANDLKQWMIGAAGTLQPKRKFDGRPERNFNLRGLKLDRYLQHEKQRFGINLGWTDDASAKTAAKVTRWFFARESSDDGALRYAETIALGNGGDPSFVRHENRTVGVNLGWSKTPVYEWKILGGTAGTPVQAGQNVALFNEKANECLIYFDRTAGGDIGWPTSQRWEDQLKSLAVKTGKEAAKKAVLAALGL
ncbi:hypothetical protein GCM10011504_11230 [Siccirubricoccus deserti]|uniref:Uncharacterized protein n=1 Tax=Siccirubricoccus deserti TaxID=2013562 RepID=A0A9X0QWV9_9PROT|nr:hypothetical protein [Siccirubricoccus deserti]MBC4014738.1 hypothetical protein [Siccirubricoccus deserti]GGC34579.1 hypothetical protein GCM10011504_11230 [Siccirubricoccus deserti]